MWFETLMGFREESLEQVRKLLSIDDATLRSSVNDQSYQFGHLEISSLADFQKRTESLRTQTGRLRVSEVVADVQQLHVMPMNAGALFQVASQFNLLEMVGPSITPEQGVAIYENDRTQGPACAIACGAGTIYRNYFVNVNGQIGQSASCQIDCLHELGLALGNTNNERWTMRNGYALASSAGLKSVTQQLAPMNEIEKNALRGKLKIGLQWNTQVTLKSAKHFVSQAFCSALPVAYSSLPANEWEPFAKLILEAAYEATLCAAILNSEQTGSKQVFLTLLGGGAFGNREEWIIAAMQRAFEMFQDADLDVSIVSYGSHNPALKQLVRSFNK